MIGLKRQRRKVEGCTRKKKKKLSLENNSYEENQKTSQSGIIPRKTNDRIHIHVLRV